MDERTLREIYLQPFERVVKKARPWSIMTAYNKLNGTYCSQNAWLLQTVLREEWGFDGAVISDWGAVSGVAESIAAGQTSACPALVQITPLQPWRPCAAERWMKGAWTALRAA